MRPAHLKEQREKEVRALYNRRTQIFREQSALGFKKLEKPIRHGWYKEVVLTAKRERYKSKPQIEEIFDKMKQRYWGRTKKECDRKWETRVSDHFIVRDLPTLSRKQFNKLSIKAQQLCVPYYYYENKNRYTRFYVRFPKSSFQIKYTRAYITHTKIIDSKLISEQDLIEQQLLKPGYYNIDNKCGYKNRWDPKTKYDEFCKEDSKVDLRRYRFKDLKTISWERNLREKI